MVFLIRLDDACPTMDRDKWEHIINFLIERGISPLVGVIPACQDPKMQFMPHESDCNFWQRMRKWQREGCVMALHGYDHCYISSCGGVNPVNKRSEFAGLPYETQASKLRRGYSVLKEQGLNVEWFFAPAHTYDENTLKALKRETPIYKVSDTIALRPYQDDGLLFCPVQSGHFFYPRVNGTWTFCFHPSTMTSNDFINFEIFVEEHLRLFGNFEKVSANDRKTIVDRFLSWGYFGFRKFRTII